MKRFVAFVIALVLVMSAATALASGKSKKSDKSSKKSESIIVETYTEGLDLVEVAHTEIITVDDSYVHHEGDHEDYHEVHYTEIHTIPGPESHHQPVQVTPVSEPVHEEYVEIGYPIAPVVYHLVDEEYEAYPVTPITPVMVYHWPVHELEVYPVSPITPVTYHWPIHPHWTWPWHLVPSTDNGLHMSYAPCYAIK